MNTLLLIFTFFVSLSSFSAHETERTFDHSKDVDFLPTSTLNKDQVEILNELKDEINSYYGLDNGNPRINSGPCGRFANLFYQKWNERFVDKVSISFIMSADSSECYHILLKLPNDKYYDGGNGILKRNKLIKGFEKGTYIIDMIEYDFELLDEMSYGLQREYKLCPNYSDVKTSEIIEKNLMRITEGRIES
ncbi:MAG: hypothetical protein ACI837_002110 [Crocinitomicaceae bacterium]|jgi:hypothetical protein